MKVREAIERGLTDKENVIAFIEGYDGWERFIVDMKDYFQSARIEISDEEADSWDNILEAEIIENPELDLVIINI